MGLAHYFTLLRVFISPLFPLVYLQFKWLGIPFVAVPYVLLFLLCICEFSDVFDGMIARRLNQVTDLGKVLDPMADSVTRVSLLLTFTQEAVALPLFLVLIFFYRDCLITALRTLCALRGVALGARFSGKVKAVMQACVLFLIVILMIPYSLGMLSLELFQQISLLSVAVVAFYTALSAGEYIYANRACIRKALQVSTGNSLQDTPKEKKAPPVSDC